MNLREMIETGAHKIGNQKLLAHALGITPTVLADAKAGRRGLPNVSAAKLADLLGIDRFTVIAASELTTEKDPEKIEYLRPFLSGIPRIAAAWILAAFAAVTGSFTTDARASAGRNDRLFVTQTTREAAPLQQCAMPNNVDYVNCPCRFRAQYVAYLNCAFSFRGFVNIRVTRCSSMYSTPAISRRFFSSAMRRYHLRRWAESHGLQARRRQYRLRSSIVHVGKSCI